MELFIGIILGAILSFWGMSFFNQRKGVQKIERQSIILIEKIKSVCKLISVEPTPVPRASMHTGGPGCPVGSNCRCP